MTRNLNEFLGEHFVMVEANTPTLKEEVYRLRYHVYCLETGFESPESYPDGLEKDEYDDSSMHYLIQHRKTGLYAATTRLILPDPTNPGRPFPLELHSHIERQELLQTIPREHLAEASRFCISKDFKRRAGESGTLAGIPHEAGDYAFSENERRTIPYLTLALFACLVNMSVRNGITHWYAIMEPALVRFFTRLGIHFLPIGPLTDYHGLREPCFIKLQCLLDGVKEKGLQEWELLTDKGRFWRS
jgi:N-acyl amino acid synthase of PEP-CTERM/exosortase system